MEGLAMTSRIERVRAAVAAAGMVSALALGGVLADAAPRQLAQAAPAPGAPTSQAAPAPVAPPGQAAPGLAAPPAAGEAAPKGPLARVETRIADMHAKLHITAAQEPQFTAMADVMRENVKAMADLLHERGRSSITTALAALRWYERITEAHAEALRKFVPAFEKLYVDLSADQQKTADALFRRLAERPMPHRVQAK
jgi:periplasmic protein CpxP/Spy